MEGDHTLFLRQDGVERAWELLEPVLDVPGEVVRYPCGGWGPAEADALIAPRKWHTSAEETDGGRSPGGNRSTPLLPLPSPSISVSIPCHGGTRHLAVPRLPAEDDLAELGVVGRARPRSASHRGSPRWR